MKKKTLKALFLLAAVILAASVLFGCSAKTAGGEGYKITLEKQEADVFAGEKFTLPAPVAVNTAGTDISDVVLVEVLFQDGSVYIPAHRYSLSPEFTAHTVGKYYAVYTVKTDDGRTVAKETLAIDVAKADTGAEIHIDGVLDEALYSEGYRTGVDGNLLFKYYFAQKGIFIGVEVADTQLVYNDYLVSRLTQSDGFEICLNFSGEESDRLNASCRKIRVSLNGEVYVYVPSEAKSFYELNESMTALLDHAVRIHGTKSVVGSKAVSSLDEDTGYVFEAFLEYESLGVDVPSEYIGIAFAQRDMTSVHAVSAALGGVGNRYFSEVEWPDGIQPVLSENGQNYVYTTYEALALTCLYNKLYFEGEHSGVAVPQANCAIQIDGIADEALWSSAADVGSIRNGTARADAKAFVDSNGLYVCIEVLDKDIHVLALGDIFGSDCVQLRVACADTVAADSLPKGFGTPDKVITLSPSGAVLKTCLNASALLYTRGFDSLQAVQVSKDGYTAEIFIPAYAYGGASPAVCIGFIHNETFEYAGVGSMTFSCNSNTPSAYTKIGG